MRTPLALLFALTSFLPAASAQQATPTLPFTNHDLAVLSGEVGKVVPANPHFTYPVEVRVVDKREVNAWTYVILRDGKRIPQLEVMAGLVELARGDRRILRAVIAHELAHLALGHSLETPALADLAVAHTRQQEFEADAYGAHYLEMLGHSREDLVDVLKLLDQDTKNSLAPWLVTVTSDHASPITRAARLTGDEDLLVAVTRFELGLAYMECRRYPEAIAFFDEAKHTSWKLFEADLNAASAALQDYYDRLPAAVQEEWLRPEFGAHLTDVLALRGRAIEITPADLARYDEALRRIGVASPVFSPPMQAFLLATAHVLNPKGDEAVLRKGVQELQALIDGQVIGSWDSELLRLRATNNLAVGLARLGEQSRAAQLLLAEQMRKTDAGLPSVIENLARLPLDGLAQDQVVPVAQLLYSYLAWTPTDVPGARAAQRAFDGLKRKYGLEVKVELQRSPVALCGVAMMSIDGHDVGLFQPFTKVNDILGALPQAGEPNTRFPDLKFLLWGDSEVIALVEREQLVKLTSYRAGSSLALRPLAETGSRASYVVRVGMSEAELERMLAPAGGAQTLKPQDVTLLSRRSFTRVEQPPAQPSVDDADSQPAPEAAPQPEENWRYYPQLNFGVLIENGVVTGITVAPAA